jgi:hypothetical protein
MTKGGRPDVRGVARGTLARVETHARDRSVRNCIRGRLRARGATRPSRVATPSRSPRSCVPTWRKIPRGGGPIRPGRGRPRGTSPRPRRDRRRRRHDPRRRVPRLLVRPRPVAPARARLPTSSPPSAPPGNERRRLSATREKRPRSALTPRPRPSFVSPARTPPPSPSSMLAASSSRTRWRSSR